jgi:hypothetical protein
MAKLKQRRLRRLKADVNWWRDEAEDCRSRVLELAGEIDRLQEAGYPRADAGSHARKWSTSSITPKQKDVVPAMMGFVVVVHRAFSIRDSRVQPVKWRTAMAKLMKASLWGKREFEAGSLPDNRTINAGLKTVNFRAV